MNQPPAETETDEQSAKGESSPVSSRRRYSWKSFSIKALLMLMLLAALASWYIHDQLRQPLSPVQFWDVTTGERIKWSVELGPQTYSEPSTNRDYVYVGSSNAGLDPLFPKSVDVGAIYCFDKADGDFVWQYTAKKLEAGRRSDWPMQGITNRVFAENDLVWFIDNRGQVICADADGFRDGINDGPYQLESQSRLIDADVIWKYDLLKQLDVLPHNTSHCNVVVDDQRIYLNTSHGVEPDHRQLKNPHAPSFVVLDKFTGKLIWSDNRATPGIMHACWGSPALATLHGKRQVLFCGGDGWLYSFEPAGDRAGNPVLLWKFDCNLKDAPFEVFGRGDRNQVVVAPTVVGNRVLISMGQEPEHGVGPIHVWCIDPGNRRGDLSPTLVTPGDRYEPPSRTNQFLHCNVANGDREIPNPDSALVWRYSGHDFDGDGELDDLLEQMNRGLSSPCVFDRHVVFSTMDGVIHCLALDTGEPKWSYDTRSGIWASMIAIDQWLYIGTEDGEYQIFDIGDQPPQQPIAVMPTLKFNSVYGRPAFRNGVLYLVSRTRLTAVEDPDAKNELQKYFLD